jgi:hypothetical protein
VLQAGGALGEDEGVQVGLALAGGQGQAQHAHIEPGGGQALAVANAPGLLGGQLEHAVLDRAWAAVVGQDDRTHAAGQQLLSPLLAHVAQAGVGQSGQAEPARPVGLRHRQGLELALSENDGVVIAEAVPAEGQGSATLGVAAGERTVALAGEGAGAQVDHLAGGEVGEEQGAAEVRVGA